MAQLPLFVAHDAAPCEAFRLVLKDQPGWTGVLLDAGKNEAPPDNVLRDMVANASVVMVGLSSEKTARIEIRACELALELDKPFVFFSDTFRAWARSWFASFREHVHIVTVVAENEVSPAQGMYPDAEVIFAGNPSWETYFTDVGNREYARNRMGVAAEHRVILVSGTKDFAVNKELIRNALQASTALADMNPVVVFSQHPGDETAIPEYEGMLIPAGGTSLVVMPSREARGDEIVFGADVLVSYNAASLAVRWVALRHPLVCVSSPLALARFRSEGGDTNPLVDAGAAWDGGPNAETLAEALQLSVRNPGQLGQAQEIFLPRIEPGAYVGNIVRILA